MLKTLFCCSACDGEIAQEEIELVKQLSHNVDRFRDINVEKVLNGYVSEINHQGRFFLHRYLNELSEAVLTESEQIELIDLAVKMIEADNVIQYSEVKFFKKLRGRLSISDTAILESMPAIEDYLLPDISIDGKDTEELGFFEMIKLDA